MSTSPHNLDRAHASFEQTIEEIKGLARQIGSPAGTPRYADRDGRVHGWNFRAVERNSGYLDWDSAGSEEASKLEHFKEEMEPFPGGSRCVFPPPASGPRRARRRAVFFLPIVLAGAGVALLHASTARGGLVDRTVWPLSEIAGFASARIPTSLREAAASLRSHAAALGRQAVLVWNGTARSGEYLQSPLPPPSAEVTGSTLPMSAHAAPPRSTSNDMASVQEADVAQARTALLHSRAEDDANSPGGEYAGVGVGPDPRILAILAAVADETVREEPVETLSERSREPSRRLVGPHTRRRPCAAARSRRRGGTARACTRKHFGRSRF